MTRWIQSESEICPRGQSPRPSRESGPRFKPCEPGAHHCTFAVTDVAALMVKLQLFVFAPPLEQPPDQMAVRPLLTVSVTDVPVAKLALAVVPTLTASPAGVDEIDSPARPVAVRVSWTMDAGAVGGGGGGGAIVPGAGAI